MKTHSIPFALSLLVSTFWQSSQLAGQAASLYWDVNGTGTGFSTVVGGWNGTNAFWNDQVSGTGGTPLALTTNVDDLNIVAATTNTGTITLTGAQVANSITYGSTVGAVTISGGTSITLGNGTADAGGITVNSGAGAQIISTAIVLANSQTWTNNSANTLTTNGGLNLGANTLTFSGSGNFSFGTVAASVISNGSIVMNGTGLLQLGAAATVPVHTYSGGTTITNGTVMFSGNLPASGNLTLNGGVYQEYFGSSFTRALGSGSGQIQVTGGASGFSGQGATSTTFNIGGAAATLVWGSAFFNPSTLILQAANAGVNTNGKMSLSNGINLSGSDRIIASNQTTDGVATSGATIAGVISNSTGTAGFEKTGVGNLILSNTANTYNGTTTISGGWITAAGSGALGNASVTNTLIFNGGTLRASGAITSPSTRSVTMTQTGIIDTNGQAVSIAGNITGAGGLTKSGTGTFTLSGTNSFGGVTTVNTGTLAITKEAALYNATPASWTAANLNVKSGATLQLNVDSAGTAGFTSANLNTLLGNILVANTAAQGLQAGAILAFDTATATGGTFTLPSAITNSTGAFGGAISLNKVGAGTLVVDQANTYTGGTTISAGTLQLNDGGSILGPLVNNGVLFVNKTGALTSGTDFPSNIGGTGSIAIGAAATLTVTTPTQFQLNALNTTGGGSFILSGVTTPILGGLSGATGNLSSAFSGGYGSVSNLTLNTPSGISFTYAGVIDNGAAGMSLTKIGAGTQTLTGNNTYTGTTYLNGGALHVGTGSTIGKLSGTTDLNFNGGTLQFNRSGTTDIDAINNVATVTVNSSSTFGVTSADAGNANANETIGAVTLNAGQMNFNWTNGGSSGTQMILTSLSRSGTASANFNSGFASNNSRWKVTGAGTTTGGQIIGPWYTTGGNNAGFASTDYAIYSSDFVAQAAIAGSAETTWTAAANAYTNALAAQTLTTTRTITALRNTGATATLTLATGANLETYGLLNGVTTLLTVATGTGGVLTTPTGGGNLYVNAGAGAITVSAPINNNSGNVTLVKNGSGTLTLSSTTSNYSGGTVINAGTLAATADTNLGATAASPGAITAAQAIMVNGNATLTLGTATYNRSVSIASGATAFFTGQGNTPTITGAVTGAGGIGTTGGNAASSLTLSSTGNTFTGGVTVGITGGSSSSPILNIASLVDTTSPGAGNILFSYGTNAAPAVFNYMSTAVAPLTLNNRQIVVGDLAAGNTDKIANLNTTQAITINSNLLVATTFAGTHTLNLDAVAGPTNAFNGMISDGGAGVVIAVSKTGAGTWALSGNNTYTGQTIVANNGTLILSGDNISMIGGVVLSASSGNTPKLHINSATAIGTGTLNFGGGAASDTVQIDNTSAGAVAVSTGNAITMNRNFTFVGTQDLSLGTGTTTLGGMTSGSNRSITVTAKTLTLNGTIAEAVTNLGITKAGAGTLVLSGPSNSYTGATTVSAGTLVGTNATRSFGTNLSGISIAAAGTLSLRNDSTVSFTNGTSAYNIATTASGATINVDRVTGTGTNTITVGNLTTSSTAGSWGLNFTGANGVSLSAGALNTPVSTIAAVHTITNNIAGGGSLTLASVFNQATTIASPDLVFTGTGNTIVTGAITQTLASMDLIKNGAGTLILNGTNTYTGVTTVNAGTLGGTGTLVSAITVSAGGSLAPGSSVGASVGTLTTTVGLDISAMAGLSGTGKLKFDLGPVAASDKLVTIGTVAIGSNVLAFDDFTFTALGGLQNGTYKLITSGGITGTLDPILANLTGPVGGGTGTLQITGNDIELVVSGVTGLTGYSLWASTNATTTTPAQDQDGDGVSNAVEYVLGGSSLTNDISKLPVPSVVGGNLLFTFQRSQASIDGSTVAVIEVGTDLASWPTPSPYTIPDVAAINNPGVSVQKGVPTGFDTITLSIPQGSHPRKFARLKVTTAP